MALYGLQPVVEIQFMDFIYPAFNEIVSELAKLRYRSGGQDQARVVIVRPTVEGSRAATTIHRAPRPTSSTLPGSWFWRRRHPTTPKAF